MATTLLKNWFRPSLIVFTKDQPTAADAPNGSWNIGTTAGTDYIFLTDDNRSSLQVSVDRIDYKKRMINGRMRSYHVADKNNFSVSWNELPSSASYVSENRKTFNAAWASGKEILKWHDNHADSFYMMLIYDTPDPEGTGTIPLKYKVETYNVFFQDISYNITKRGTAYDHWDLSLSLVEV